MLDPLVPGAPVLVAGARVTGRAVLAALTRFGAIPTMCDDDPAMLRPFAESGVATVDPSVAVQQLAQPEPSSESRYALVVTSPGFQPSTPVLAAAAAAGVPIWGDVELAWRLDAAGCYGPPRRWLVVTGTNGKTTTTSMLHAMLVAGQHRSVLCGNIGSPVLDVLEEPADLLAVELSSFQLRWAPSLRPEAGVVLNIAEDHLDWHGTMAAYTEAKARVLTGRVAVVGLDDSRAAALRDTAPAPVASLPNRYAGGRRVGPARRASRRPGLLRRSGAVAGLLYPGAGTGGSPRHPGRGRIGSRGRGVGRCDRRRGRLVSGWPAPQRSCGGR